MTPNEATLSANPLSTWAPRLLSVLRITAAFTFLQHGSAKLLGFPQVEMFANLQIASRTAPVTTPPRDVSAWSETRITSKDDAAC